MKDSFILPASSQPPRWHCSAPRVNSQLEGVRLTGKGRARWVTSFPSHLKHCRKKTHFSFILPRDPQSWDGMDSVETGRRKKGRGLPVSAMQWSNHVSQGHALQGPQQLLLLKKPMTSTAALDPLQISPLRFSPYWFLRSWSFWSPVAWVLLYSLPSEPGIHTGSQPQPL